MSEQAGNSVTVVTGAAGALGSGLARYLAGRGHRVVAIGRPESQPRLAELAQELPGILPLEADVTSADAWRRLVGRMVEEVGVPTAGVLVAGGFAGGKSSFEGDTAGVWQKMLAQNLQSAQATLDALLPLMVKAQHGSVVLIGSRAAVRPWEAKGAAAYAASKAAVVALTQTAAAEVLQYGVRVNAVLPSTIDTAANRQSMPQADYSRWVSLASLCNVIGFLLSECAADVSGAAIPVFGRGGG